jgi:hypothetical protein
LRRACDRRKPQEALGSADRRRSSSASLTLPDLASLTRKSWRLKTRAISLSRERLCSKNLAFETGCRDAGDCGETFARSARARQSAKIEIQRFRSISWHQFDTLDNGSHPRPSDSKTPPPLVYPCALLHVLSCWSVNIFQLLQPSVSKSRPRLTSLRILRALTACGRIAATVRVVEIDRVAAL